MDSIRKDAFKRSLLSSAILISIQSFASTASAGICPPPNPGGNIHVSQGDFCSGGITTANTSINDIGIEGYVQGDVINEDGMSDFWMNGGTLEGSFINDNIAQDLNISNGARIFANIHNIGEMAHIRIADGPDGSSLIDGSIINTGKVNNSIKISGAEVKGQVLNNGNVKNIIISEGSTVDGITNNRKVRKNISIDASTVSGAINNDGVARHLILKNGSIINNDVTNSGRLKKTLTIQGQSNVSGDITNAGLISNGVIINGSSTDGSLINAQDAEIRADTNGIFINNSIIGQNIENAGIIYGQSDSGIDLENTTVHGSVINSGSIESGAAFQPGLDIVNNTIIKNNVHNTNTGTITGVAGIEIKNSTIEGDLLNDGTITGTAKDGIRLYDSARIQGSLINNGIINAAKRGIILEYQNNAIIQNLTNAEDGTINAGRIGIQVKGNASISGELRNEGLIEAGPAGGNDPINAPVKAGISLEGNSIVGSTLKGITNTGIIRVLANIEHNGEAFSEGTQANGIQVIDNAVSGRIENHGEIIADTYGIYVDGTTVDGSIINAEAGTIRTGDNGIYLKDAHIKGSVINSGSIVSEFDNAIDIEDSTVDFDIVINGSLTANADYDALSINRSFIAGNVITGGPLPPLDPTIVTITGEDGLDIDDTTITGAVISSANINVASEGVDFDETLVGLDFINNGNITAGGTGISFEGDLQPPEPPEELGSPMLMMVDPIPPQYTAAIGGGFDNSGAIHAGENGIDLNRISVAGSFENRGEIHAVTGTAITLSAATIGQDFINEGNLYADTPALYPEGAYYYNVMDEEPREDGEILLTSLGLDHGNQVWLKISNNSYEQKSVQLIDTDGGFASREFDLYPGQEILVNTGEYNGGLNNHELIDTHLEEVIAATDVINQSFEPEIIETDQRGIALIGNFYAEDEPALESQVSIDGKFHNKGSISAIAEAVYLTDTSISDDFINDGQLSSLAGNGLVLNGNVTIGGSFTNNGNISADESGIEIESSSYINDEGIMDGDSLIVIGGDFTNSGTIIGRKYGIHLEGVQLDGNFTNDGDITSGDRSAIEIDDAIIDGNIINYGKLTVTEEDDENHGLSVIDSHIKGSILNLGDMDINGTEGIYLEETRVEGNIINGDESTIGSVTIDAYSDAILLDDGTTVQGNLINYGTLIARNHDGIDLDQTNIDGNVENYGSITSSDNAFELDGDNDGDAPVYMTIQGSLINSGNLLTQEVDDEDSDQDGNGFDMDYVDIRTDLINSGNINSIHHGFLIQKSRIGGNFANSGVLDVAASGIVLEGLKPSRPAENIPMILSENEEPHRLEIGGFFYNEGQITAGQNGIFLDRADIGINGDTADGAANFENHGNIEVTRGTAIQINDSNIAGNFINTGDLIADELYVYQAGDSYRRSWDGELNNGESPFVLEAAGTDENGDEWFKVRFDEEFGGSFPVTLIDEAGEIIFSGASVEAGEELYVNAGQLQGDLILTIPFEPEEILAQASPTPALFEPEYDPRSGITIENTEIGGAFINSGDISAYHSGLDLHQVSVNGGVSNSGNITANDYGITITDSQLSGDVINTIDAAITMTGNDPESGIRLDTVTGVGHFINHGTITSTDDASGDGMLAMDITMDGVMANTGTIEAETGMLMFGSDGATAFTNEGIITTEGPAMVVIESSVNGNIGVSADGIIDTEFMAGIFLGGVWNIDNLINEGRITVIDGDGITAIDSELDENVINTGTIAAGGNGISLYDLEASTIYNNGTITAGTYVEEEEEGPMPVSEATVPSGSGTGIYLSDSALQGNITNDVDGSILAATHGISLNSTNGATNILNEGRIEVGTDAIKLSNSSLDRIEDDGDFNSGNIINYSNGVIIAGDDAIRISNNSLVEGDIGNSGIITAIENAIDIDDSTVTAMIVNSGNISSGDVTIDIGGEDSDEASSIGEIRNSGTLTSENGAVVRVADSSLGSIYNIGTLNGGQVSGDEMEAERAIIDGTTVAIDFRTAITGLDLYNGSEDGNNGIINGDIHGSEHNDRIVLAAGELNGDIYDVESIDITGIITLNNDIFHFNNSSTLNVQEPGTLAFGVTNIVSVEGDYTQDGTLSVVLNENTTDLAEPVLKVTGSASLNEGSTISLSVEDRNIANFNPGTTGENVHLIHADSGVTGHDNVTVASDSVLFNYSTFISGEDTEFGVIGTITDLGTLASSGGASTNAVNAISTFQGENSEGLVDLYTSSPDLYNAIYDGTEASLTELAEQLIAGNPGNSIAASQNAQNEAINTILGRIADLRTGVSGISAGDGEGAGNNLRPDSLWIRAIYSDGDQKARNEFGGYSLRSKGFTLGADKDINDYLTLGLGMTMVTSTTNQTSSGTRGNNGETDTYLGSLYAGWRNQDYFVDANFNLGTSKTDLSGTGWNTRFDSSQIAISALAGKSFLFNSNDSLIEPSIGVNFTKLKSDSYSYEATNVGETSLEALELGAGVRYMTSFDVGSGQLLPEVSLMAWHDFKAEAVEAEIGFENSGGTFTYFGPEAVKNRYQASAGVEYWMDNNFTLSLNYDHNWQSGFKADTVQAKLRYDF
ncbi:autotransporter outer membrane beta-barrel domain-containing protein [Endozoicomonas atrinae]|uniref:autotransporter outer membrane beta-barrel domain-containing protein n=1 Tax=Endozoicomonas atrinae TaxID=1333660 RepID=UPI00082695FE|nr:autotransporter outer membrane beta-barrel domain-containing protein [Endozoicomonas atrinae]